MRKIISLAAVGILFSLPCAAQTLNIYCEDQSQAKGPDGRFVGVDWDIVSEIQKRVGNSDKIQLVPWTRGLKYVESDPNTLLFSMARTKDRNLLYQWIGPISETSYGFYVKSDSKIVINSLDDAKKVASIGVYRNDIRDQFLTQEGFTNLDRADNSFSNLKKLFAGRVAVIASTAIAVKSETRRTGHSAGDVKFLYAFLKLPIYIAASKKTDPKIVASWNAALEGMKKDGTLRTILRKYSTEQQNPGPDTTVY